METLSAVDFLLRLGVGVGCGALIGLERQWRARRAGLRTNALVAAGATLFVLYAAATSDTSPTRVASYVVSGIGFLGGGVILREGVNVRGSTRPPPCGVRRRSACWPRPGIWCSPRSAPPR